MSRPDAVRSAAIPVLGLRAVVEARARPTDRGTLSHGEGVAWMARGLDTEPHIWA